MPLDYTHKLIHTTPLHKPQVYAHSPRTLPIGKRTNPMHFVPNTHIIHPLHIHKFTLPPLPACKYRTTEAKHSHLCKIHHSHIHHESRTCPKPIKRQTHTGTRTQTHTAPEATRHRKANKHTTCYEYTKKHPRDKERFEYLKYMKNPTAGLKTRGNGVWQSGVS